MHLGMVDQVTPGGNARSAAVNRRRIYFSVPFLFLIWVVVRSIIICDRDNTAGNFLLRIQELELQMSLWGLSEGVPALF